jgi:lambda family phage portal protein
MKKTFLNRMGLATVKQVNAVSKLNGQRAFWASQITKYNQDLSAGETQIDQDIRSGGKSLRGRARLLALNNSIVRRYIQLYLANVVGANGHTFQSNVTELVEDTKTNTVKRVPDKIANLKIASHWAEFQKGINCSIDGIMSYASLSKLAATYRVRDGEVFIMRVNDPNAAYGLRLQIIPPELIDEEYTQDLGNNNQVVMGVELNQFRQPVAYHFRKQTPLQSSQMSYYTGNRVRIPAMDIIHWFDPEFANQTRGFTRFAPVLLLLHYLDQFEKWSVQNARFGATKGGFFGDDAGNPDDTLLDTQDNTKADDIEVDIESLSFQHIGSSKFYPWDPKFPVQQHEMFMRTTLRDVASGVGCGYSSLSNDYVGATWSSLRQELYVERRNWLSDQQSLIDLVHMRVFAWWLESALLTGKLGLPYAKKQKFYQPVFTGPRWPYINPVDETKAKQMSVRTLQQSILDSTAETGETFEQICADYQEAQGIAESYGLDLDEMLADNGSKPQSTQDPQSVGTHSGASDNKVSDKTNATDNNNSDEENP